MRLVIRSRGTTSVSEASAPLSSFNSMDALRPFSTKPQERQAAIAIVEPDATHSPHRRHSGCHCTWNQRLGSDAHRRRKARNSNHTVPGNFCPPGPPSHVPRFLPHREKPKLPSQMIRVIGLDRTMSTQPSAPRQETRKPRKEKKGTGT